MVHHCGYLNPSSCLTPPPAVDPLGPRSPTIWLPGAPATCSHQLQEGYLALLPACCSSFWPHKWISATFWRQFRATRLWVIYPLLIQHQDHSGHFPNQAKCLIFRRSPPASPFFLINKLKLCKRNTYLRGTGKGVLH